MWISKRELQSLKDRISSLENTKANANVTVRGWRGTWHTTDDYLALPIDVAIRALADHLGLEFDRTQAVPEQVILKKKPK